MILYTGINCAGCNEIKEILKAASVAYEERNIANPVYRLELIKKKVMSIPAAIIDDSIFVGGDAIKNKLGL